MSSDQCPAQQEEELSAEENGEGGVEASDETVPSGQTRKEAAVTLRQLLSLNRCEACDLHKNSTNAYGFEQNNVDGVGSDNPDILLVFDSIINPNKQNYLQENTLPDHYVALTKTLLSEQQYTVRKTGAIRCAAKTTNAYLKGPVMRYNNPTVKGFFKACKHHLINEIEAVDPKVVILFGPGPFYSVFNKTDITESKVGGIYKKDGRIYIYTSYQKSSPNVTDELFKNLVKKIPFLLENKDLNSLGIKIQNIADEAVALDIMEKLKSVKALAFDFEVDMDIESKTNGFKPGDKLLGVGLSWNKHRSVFIPLDHDESPFKDNLLIRQKLKELLLSDVPKIGHNLGFDVYCAWHFLDKIEVNNLYFDTMLAHHLLNPARGTHSLKYLSTIYTEFGGYEEELQKLLSKLDKTIRSYGAIPLNSLGEYCNIDCIATYKLYDIFKLKIASNPKFSKLFEKIVMPVLEMILEIKKTPWIIDTDKLTKLEILYKDKIDKEILAVANNPIIKKLNKSTINLNSPAQLTELLFTSLNLPINKLTKSGKPSTDASVLKALLREADGDLKDLLNHILKYKHYSTLVGTFMKGMKARINNGTIISEYLAIGTETCRLSSKNPNLQNIPSDYDIEDKEESVKSIFVAPKGYSLLVADYSQIELRNLGNISKDTAIIKAFTTGQNIHIQTTSNCFGLGYDDVDKDSSIYRVGKTVNFAGVYGAGPARLAEQLDEKGDITNPELEQAIEKLTNERFTIGCYATERQVAMIPRCYYTKQGSAIAFQTGKIILDRHLLLLIMADVVLNRMKNAWVGAEMWKKSAREFANKLGYTVSPFGRVRKITFEKYGDEVKGAYNMSINTPIQSVSSDCLLISLATISKYLKTGGYKTRIVGTVHDSALFYLHDDEEFLIPILKTMLESTPETFDPDFFDIPLVVEFKRGSNWANVKDIVVE